jgi:hypothetical protein
LTLIRAVVAGVPETARRIPATGPALVIRGVLAGMTVVAVLVV